MLIIIAGLGGYVLGERGNNTPNNAAAGGGTATTGEGTGAQGGDTAALAALVAPGKGDRTEKAIKANDDGTYDAMIFGPGGPLETQDDILNIHRRNPADPFAIGAIDAPVVISEYSDFECPFCSRYANQTEPTILKDYVDKGLVRIEWNDMAINGPNAVAAAKAGRAAAEQGKFQEFKHALYSASKDINGHPGFDIDDFVRFAEEAGVEDMDKFREDATSDKFDQVVSEARAYASSLGVTGTPGFLVGDQFIAGAQPTENFIEVINNQLARAQQGINSVPEEAKKAAKN